MLSFYLLPKAILYGLLVLLFAAAILQTLSLSYEFRALECARFFSLETLREGLILGEVFFPVALLSSIIFNIEPGFYVPGQFCGGRWGIALLLLIISLIYAWKKKAPLSFLTVFPAVTVLPVLEPFPAFFPLFIAGTVFRFLRSGQHFLRQLGDRQHNLTFNSIKEVLDQLNPGLLYASRRGQILLQNQLMQKLAVNLTGSMPLNGKTFYEALLEGRVMPGCRKVAAGDQPAFELQDGRIWSFTIHSMDGRQKMLLLASDITEWWNTSQSIQEKNQELEEKNAHLREVLSNLEEICRNEALLKTKSKVHDVLGQDISLLLRAMRSHQEPDEVLLQSFADGLPKELRETEHDSGFSLDALADGLRSLGVTLDIEGQLPREEPYAHTMYEVVVEAVTNAVRHGYASRIDLFFTEDADTYRTVIRNRGLLPEGPVQEGGGLRGMREKVNRLGGWFHYETAAEFRVCAELPKGAQI